MNNQKKKFINVADTDNERNESEMLPRKRKRLFHAQFFIIKSYRKEFSIANNAFVRLVHRTLLIWLAADLLTLPRSPTLCRLFRLVHQKASPYSRLGSNIWSWNHHEVVWYNLQSSKYRIGLLDVRPRFKPQVRHLQ